jgi:hypothetical protein
MKAFLCGVLIFPIALLLHESMHLLALAPLGGHGGLIVRPWHLALANLTIPGLHVTGGDELGLGRLLLFDFAGPALAAVPLALIAWLARRGPWRTALLANLVVLAFFAVLEPAFEVVEANRIPPGPLSSPEFNYGVPLLLIVLAAILARPSARATV